MSNITQYARGVCDVLPIKNKQNVEFWHLKKITKIQNERREHPHMKKKLKKSTALALTLGLAFSSLPMNVLASDSLISNTVSVASLVADPTALPFTAEYFPDENLRAVLKRECVWEEGGVYDLTQWMYADIEKMICDYLYPAAADIKDLTGMEYFIKLKWLYIVGTQASDLTPISNLTALTRLTLESNRNITDIQSLSNLTNLVYLSLAKSNLTSLKGLENLTNLTELRIEGANGNLPLTEYKYLPNCEFIIYSDAGIDLSKYAPHLDFYEYNTSGSGSQSATPRTDWDTPYLTYDGISYIVSKAVPNGNPQVLATTLDTSTFPDENLMLAVASCLGLEVGAEIDEVIESVTSLDLSEPIEDFTGLDIFTNLTELTVAPVFSANSRALPTQIASLTNLEYLEVLGVDDDLDSKSLDGIDNLENLKTLIIDNVRDLEDLKAVGNLPNLENLGIIGVSPSDLDFLSNLENLKVFVGTAEENKELENFTPFTPLSNLETIVLDNYTIKTSYDVGNIAQLKHLYLPNSTIQNFDGFKDFSLGGGRDYVFVIGYDGIDFVYETENIDWYRLNTLPILKTELGDINIPSLRGTAGREWYHIEVDEVTYVNKTYNWNDKLEIEKVTFKGLPEGVELTLGEDYTVTVDAFSDIYSHGTQQVKVRIELLETENTSKLDLDTPTYKVIASINGRVQPMFFLSNYDNLILEVGSTLSDLEFIKGQDYNVDIDGIITFSMDDEDNLNSLGVHTVTVTFTPTDEAHYDIISFTANVEVVQGQLREVIAPEFSVVVGQSLDQVTITSQGIYTDKSNRAISGLTLQWNDPSAIVEVGKEYIYTVSNASYTYTGTVILIENGLNDNTGLDDNLELDNEDTNLDLDDNLGGNSDLDNDLNANEDDNVDLDDNLDLDIEDANTDSDDNLNSNTDGNLELDSNSNNSLNGNQDTSSDDKDNNESNNDLDTNSSSNTNSNINSNPNSNTSSSLTSGGSTPAKMIFNVDNLSILRNATRGETAKFMYRLVSYLSPELIDIELNTQENLANLGIMVGYSDGTFRAETKITREELADTINRAFEVLNIEIISNDLEISDLDQVKSWAVDGVEAIVKSGIMNTYSDGTFKPQNKITEKEFGQILVNIMNEINKEA